MKSANLVQIGKIVIDEHCPEPKLTSPELARPLAFW